MKKTYTAALNFVATTASISYGTGAFVKETVIGAFTSVIDAELHLALNAGVVDLDNRVYDASGKLIRHWRTAGGGRAQLEAERAMSILVASLRGDGRCVDEP